MKILVTGCAGFIGANFTEYILEKYPEDTVIGIDRLTYAANLTALKRLKVKDRFSFYQYDICDRVALEQLFDLQRPDVVVNFAAETHVDRSIESSADFIRTNVLGTEVLLDLSYRYGVKRFHQVSTDEVYGDVALSDDRRFTEDAPLNPSSPYSASKASADLIAMSYMRTHGLPVSISRSSNNYGKYQHSEKLIPATVGRILCGSPIIIYGDGSNMRNWLYVGDNCSAIDMIIRAGECGIYNVSADNQLSNIELVKRIMLHLEKPDVEIAFVEDRKGHDRKYSVSSDKLKALGWTATADFERELKHTVEWYSENK